jgi:hypothetical protein
MKIFTREIIDKMPKIGSTTGDNDQAPIVMKLFGGGSFSLYVTEATAYMQDGRELALSELPREMNLDAFTQRNGKFPEGVEDIHFFGYVTGLDFDEWGSTSWRELSAVRFKPLGLPVERDMHFSGTVAQVKAGSTY